MKIYSWNMLFKNADKDGALSFIKNSNADIFCIQEAPEEIVAHLKAVAPHTVAASEVDRLYGGVRATQYVVIVSKWPITQWRTVPLPYREPMVGLRAMLFIRVMCALRIWALGVGSRHALIANIETAEGIVQVCNVHLPLATPVWRAEEFEQVMQAIDASLPAVICGDFNVLEKPHITPLTWLLGGSVSDALLFRRERKTFEQRFAKHSLTNTLRGVSTHRISRSQLDHILVSRQFSVQSASVIRECHGSDHNPVTATIALSARKKLDQP